MPHDIDDKQAQLAELMGLGPVIAVLEIGDLATAAPLAQALVAGGVRVLEVTLRTPVALAAVRAMIAAAPEARVGTGTVRTPADLQASVEAGACFAVSPGTSPRLLDAADGCGMPLLPGAATPSEAMALCDRGYVHQKLFPAMALGGPAVLRAWSGPLAGIRYCPTGGIRADGAAEWLALPNVACVGGSWVAPADAVAAGDWSRITALAQVAARLRSPLLGG
jgi:2-dehydro-3-deoxyphosphogluconate aldolase / (4S)-4-hydroxy-2-oxoglutarate aldolase